MRKGFALPLILIIVVVSVFVVSIGYFLFKSKSAPQPQPATVSQPTSTPSSATKSNPSPNETANWKTYTNTDFGFAIKYPPNIKEFDCLSSGCNQFETTLPKGSKIVVIPFTNNVAVPSINSSRSLKEWVESKNPNGIFEGTQHTETINGLTSEIVTTNTPDEGILLFGPIHQKIAFIYKETKQNRSYTSYIISHYDKSETQEFMDDDKTFDQILSTFKFLK